MLSPTVVSGNVIFSSGASLDYDEGFLNGISSDIADDYLELSGSGSLDIDNYAEVNITNARSSSVLIKQSSLGNQGANKAKVMQEGNSNKAVIGQAGFNNTAYIRQEGNNNKALVGQIGSNSEALVLQSGDHNIAIVGQSSSMFTASKVSINQTEDNNFAFVGGSGNANLGISQNGGDIIIIDASNSMKVYIDQTN
ncbi:curlin subunit CsgB [Vibrio sp. 10N.261.51.F12]|uniref:curlin subunit CsgB n=1 Tax=Vibrio sp. 10N.261.51.F12 TaxID=3229679 RepID=UPI00354F4521